MAIPLKYNLRNLRVRWRSSSASVLSIALVVAVFVMVMALARGLTKTFTDTGDERNLLVLRKGSMAESSSQITFDEVRRVRYLDGIALSENGEPVASAELIILITMDRAQGGSAHVQVRGLGPLGPPLRPQIKIIAGRMFRPGVRECIVSRKVAQRFTHCRLGETFRSGKQVWQVVGIFEAKNTAYESEIWMDVDEAREAFNREFYDSILLRPLNSPAATRLIDRIENDKQMRLSALLETDYYRKQTKTAAPIRLFGAVLAAIMSVGAAFAAMNAMYASVAARTREISTLRVLGFSRRNIYFAFMFESVLVALTGGLLGCLLALPLHGIATGTFNWSTFAEVVFEFRITTGLLAAGMAFAVGIGIIGGFLPARAAARQALLQASRAN